MAIALAAVAAVGIAPGGGDLPTAEALGADETAAEAEDAHGAEAHGHAGAEHGAAEHAPEGHEGDGDHAADGHGDDHGAGGHAAHGPPRPLATDIDLAIWTAVVFGVLLLVLGKFAWGPIIEALEGREQKIADDLAAAEARHEEAKRLLTGYEEKLAGASGQVREMLDEARRDAERTKGEIVAEAKAAAAAEHERAMRDVRSATDGALKELAEKSSTLAVDLAGKIVAKELKPEDHAQIVRDAVHQFSSPN